jgi:hypothetical protein
MPSTGFIYVTVHVAYGLTGCGGFTKDTSNNALPCGGGTVTINNGTQYAFSVSGGDTCVSMVQNVNVFKRNPGVGGLVSASSSGSPVAGAAAVLKDSTGKSVATGLSDQDGWYVLSYKYTGKGATFSVTLTPPGKSALKKTFTLKANAYYQLDFVVP